VLLVGLISGVVTVVRVADRKPPNPSEVHMHELARDGRAVYKSIRMTSEIADEEEVRVVIEGAPVTGRDMLSAVEWNDLLDTVSTFFALRFGQSDLRAYWDWRNGRGDIFTDRQWLIDVWTIDLLYKQFSGKPFDDSVKLDAQLFEYLCQQLQQMHGGFNRLRTIASEPRGLAITIGIYTGAEPRLVSGGLTGEQWYGAISSTDCNWWNGGRNQKILLDESGSVLFAEVGVIVGFEDGSRRPMMLGLLWDAQEKRWFIEHLDTHNEPSSKQVVILY